MPTASQPTAQQPIQQVAIMCVAALIGLNIAFYFLSGSYFESHHDLGATAPGFTPDQMSHVRICFAAFSVIVAAAAFFAALWPRNVGHGLVVLFGVFNLLVAVRTLAAGGPGVLAATTLLGGGLMLALGHYSYRHRSRASWAVLVAMCGVFAAAELFGAPKVARALDISLWIAMVSPGLKVVAVFALVALRGDYADAKLATA